LAFSKVGDTIAGSRPMLGKFRVLIMLHRTGGEQRSRSGFWGMKNDNSYPKDKTTLQRAMRTAIATQRGLARHGQEKYEVGKWTGRRYGLATITLLSYPFSSGRDRGLAERHLSSCNIFFFFF
jgi:hypothetical protein